MNARMGLPSRRVACALCGLMLLLSVAAWGRSEAFSPAPGSPYRVGARPSSVVTSDFNGDGHPDILVACSGSDSLSLLLGDGRGGFARRRSFPALRAPHLLAVGEFNGDRMPDVVVSAHDANDVVVLLNSGRGNLVRQPPLAAFPGGKPHNHGLAVGDLNGDGCADITVGHQENGAIAVLLGDGLGGFRPAPDSLIAVGKAPYPHTLADLDGDGRLDLIVPDVQGNRIRAFLGNGSGGFRALPSVSTGIARPYFVIVRDLNADGKADLIVTHDDTNRVAVLLGNGRGGFRRAPSSPFDGRTASWKGDVADLNGDGRPDLALAGGGSVRIFDGDGRGGFRFRTTLRTRGESWDVILADMNEDNRPDVVTPSGKGGVVHVFLTPRVKAAR